MYRRTRLLALALAAGVLPAGLPLASPAAAATPGSDAPVVVTSVVRTTDGSLAFTHRTADSRAEGEQLADRLEDRRGVLTADVAEPVRLLATADDTYRADQWGLTRLGAESLWAEGDGSGVTVAVLDTGVDGAHPDLVGRVLAPIDLIAPGTRTAVDPNGHGTHVAGTVAALTGNGSGVASLSPGARVLPVRVLDASGSGYDSVLAEGIVKAVDAGAQVLNMSLGGDGASSVLRSAVQYALDRGVVLVAAAGNSGPTGPVEYPAGLPGVLAVGATTTTDGIASFSTHGPHVDLAAPGQGIWSTWPDRQLARKSGTSMAAPFVASAAALLLSTTTTRVSSRSVPQLLIDAADDLGARGRDDAFGHGLLDVAGVRAAVRPAPPAPAPAPAPAPPAPAPAPAAAPPAPAPAPVDPAPAAAPVAAPAPAPAHPVPAASPSPSPTASPSPAPAVAPPAAALPGTPGSTASPTASPSPAPVGPRTVGARLSTSARTVTPRSPVRVSVRALADGGYGAGLPVVLQASTGSSGWTTLRTGRAGADGLVSWELRPDRTLLLRAVVGTAPVTAVSPTARVDVRQLVRAVARRGALSAAVLPGGRTTAVLERWTGRAWAPVVRRTTTTSGRADLAARLPRGTRVRVSTPARGSLPAASSAVVRWG